MDIYKQKSRWKWYLALAGALIIAISMIFTNYLTQELKAQERNKIAQWVLALEQLNSMPITVSPNCVEPDVTLHNEILSSNNSIPVILVSKTGNVDSYVNFGDADQEEVEKELAKMIKEDVQPIEGIEGVKIYYKKSSVLRMLELFPFLQMLLIIAFILAGYFAFSSSRKSEQNRVWVGMAKETAHQLGTPVSAIIGWIDHLHELKPEDEETMEVVDELRNDVKRLELIAERFSKIGSEPELIEANVYEELEASRAYMQKRASRKVKFDFPDPKTNPITIRINRHLFHWVLENLLRNALDAMNGRGSISVHVIESKDKISIDLTDTGTGIPASKFKSVFQPGYTTKLRGWGLGLSLAKRIVEEYHKGRIYVKKSEEGKGTTFSIQLPK